MIDGIIIFCLGFLAGALAGILLMALNAIAKTWDKEDGESER